MDGYIYYSVSGWSSVALEAGHWDFLHVGDAKNFPLECEEQIAENAQKNKLYPKGMCEINLSFRSAFMVQRDHS